LETERCLNQSHEEIKHLKDFEKSASARIRVAKSAHKSAKAGLMNMKRQVTELREKLDREYATSSRLRVETSGLKDVVNEARAEVQKSEGEAQSYYDQGLDEAASSLKSQLAFECNKFFVQGWRMALNKAGVDEASELYGLAPRH
jgi:predicted nuclease with TOPRIM domain